jgi:murein DD-endopeptidase MepM/ murein hydrolase activator NlpD
LISILLLALIFSGIANLRRGLFVENSPFLGLEARRDLTNYKAFSPNKAFAASVTLNDWGWSYGYGDRAAASDAALRQCEERQVKCLLYAVGDDIVWDAARARSEWTRVVSSTREAGAVWRYYGEENQHSVEVSLPAAAPSIISDSMSERGILGGVRQLRQQTPARHTGIDIIASLGMPVLAAADGVVVDTGFENVAGKYIRIRHEGNDGTQLLTEYIHLDSIKVSAGQAVRRGQRIATVGATGSGATLQRPHLHFAVPGDNPHYYWHDGLGSVTCFDGGTHYAASESALTYPLACDGKTASAR